MKKRAKAETEEMEGELRPEYDLSKLTGGVRGKYAARYQSSKLAGNLAAVNLIRLDPDVAQAFPTEEAVNEALRLLMKIARTQLVQASLAGNQ